METCFMVVANFLTQRMEVALRLRMIVQETVEGAEGAERFTKGDVKIEAPCAERGWRGQITRRILHPEKVPRAKAERLHQESVNS